MAQRERQRLMTRPGETVLGDSGRCKRWPSGGGLGMAIYVRARLVELIVCPDCKGGLQLSVRAKEGEEITDGKLSCQACGREYPIRAGIPRLLPRPEVVSDEAQRTVDRFGEQWNEFDFLGPHYEKQFLGWIAPNGKESFRGKVVLEGGCGKGRHSALVAHWGAQDVLAVDLGSAVDAAYRNTREYPNVHVIQADLFHLPVRPASVDVAFSVGVLHHTPEPAQCFRELVSTVRPGGKVIAWVYGRENNGWIIHGVNPLREALTSRLPHRVVYQLAKLPAAVIFAVGKGVYRPLQKGPLKVVGDKLFYAPYISHIAAFPYGEIHSIVHDHLTPPIAHYIEKSDFERWFQELGLEGVTIGWHNKNSWRGSAQVPMARAPASAAQAG